MNTDGRNFNYLNVDYTIIPHISVDKQEDEKTENFKINYIMIMLDSGISHKCNTRIFEKNSFSTQNEAEEYAYSYSIGAIKNGDIIL
jgi:hypothetical protein